MSKAKSKSKTAKQRSKKKPSEFTILLKRFHKHSKRHVLILEANISDDFIEQIFEDAEYLRRMGNHLTAVIQTFGFAPKSKLK